MKAKRQKFRVEKTYKDLTNKYYLKFIYKNKIQFSFILPKEEEDYVNELEQDKSIKLMLKLYYLFYIIFGKNIFNSKARYENFDFLLVSHNISHEGEVSLEAL